MLGMKVEKVRKKWGKSSGSRPSSPPCCSHTSRSRDSRSSTADTLAAANSTHPPVRCRCRWWCETSPTSLGSGWFCSWSWKFCPNCFVSNSPRPVRRGWFWAAPWRSRSPTCRGRTCCPSTCPSPRARWSRPRSAPRPGCSRSCWKRPVWGPWICSNRPVLQGS